MRKRFRGGQWMELYEGMDGWTNGEMDGGMRGYMYVWIDGKRDGWMDG